MAEHRFAPGGDDLIRDPVTGGEGRVDPFEQEDPGPARPSLAARMAQSRVRSSPTRSVASVEPATAPNRSISSSTPSRVIGS